MIYLPCDLWSSLEFINRITQRMKYMNRVVPRIRFNHSLHYHSKVCILETFLFITKIYLYRKVGAERIMTVQLWWDSKSIDIYVPFYPIYENGIKKQRRFERYVHPYISRSFLNTASHYILSKTPMINDQYHWWINASILWMFCYTNTLLILYLKLNKISEHNHGDVPSIVT